MKYIIYTLLFLSIGVTAKAQLPSSTFPSRIFNGNTKAQWIILDSPVVNPVLDTFNARYPGTQLVRIQGGDTAFWFSAGGHLWFRGLLNRDTASLSNRINLKLNITDTIGKWLAQSTRLVDTMYRVNDSTVGYTIKGSPYTFQILGRSSGGGGGSGTVTSVALSMPSAFSVSGSPITTSGTLNVTMPGLSTQYVRANGTVATTDTGMIPNFYLKVRSLLSGTSPIVYNSTTGAISIPNANNTGTKGAATFNNSDFIDNGAGLISLRTPAGAPGVDTIFRVPGVDSIYFIINSVQRSILDSIGGGSGSQNIIDTVNKYLPNGTIYSTSYYLASASQIGLDSTWVVVSEGGDVHFKRREGGVYVDKAILSIEDDIIVSDSVPFVGPTWDASGDSYTAGVGASPSGNAYVPLLATNMSMTANNDGESGTGIMDVQFKSYRDYAPFGQENRNPRTLMIGFNDYLKSNDGSRTQVMFPYAFRAVLFNHFLDTALASNDPGLTTTGSWNTFDLSASYPQKSKYLLSGAGRLSVASSAGDSKSYTFDGENVGIIFFGANGTTQDYGRFKVEIDGVPVDTVDENGIADNQSVFANSATRTEDLISAAVVYVGLSNGAHTIKATLLDNKNTNLDAFGVMSNAPSSQSLVIGSIQKLLSAGYTALNGSFPKNDAGVDATNTIIQAVVNEFRLIGYKVVFNDVNVFTNPSTDIGVDNIHWNNSGHAKGKDSFRSKIIR